VIYDILPDTHPALHSRVPDFDSWGRVDVGEIVSNMFATMERMNAVGLAANQCGLLDRVFVMNVEGMRVACFNPVITVTAPDTILLAEGCLTFPGLSLKIKREAHIHLTYQNEKGQPNNLSLSGWPSRVAQHETDHLNGIVFTSRVSKLKLDMARKKMGE
jgi:peptide deformylase